MNKEMPSEERERRRPEPTKGDAGRGEEEMRGSGTTRAWGVRGERGMEAQRGGGGIQGDTLACSACARGTASSRGA